MLKVVFDMFLIICYFSLSESTFETRKNVVFFVSFQKLFSFFLFWCRDVVVITTAKLHSTKPELKFCAVSNPACIMLEICSGEDF